MPIFHDPDRHSPPKCPPNLAVDGYDSTMRRASEESIRTEFWDGPIPNADIEGTSPVNDVMAARGDARLETSDRAELIERIKRGESPTWVPTGNVSLFIQSTPPQPFPAMNVQIQQSGHTDRETLSRGRLGTWRFIISIPDTLTPDILFQVRDILTLSRSCLIPGIICYISHLISESSTSLLAPLIRGG